MRFIAMTVLILCLGAISSALQATRELPPSAVAEHTLLQTNPSYPELAKKKGIQGKVLIRITISPQGKVGNLRLISGHPFLVSAAMDAVKKWEYRPFLVQGVATPVDTVVEVPFVLMPDIDYEKVERLSQDYFRKSDQCRELFKKNSFAEAEGVCKSAVDAALKLPEGRSMERIGAFQLAGHSLFYQKKFQEALTFYQQQLKSAELTLKPDDSEYAYALRDVAHGYHGIGDLKAARPYYERAESSLRLAREHIESEVHKNQYSKILQGILRDYAVLLRQAGDTEGAKAAEKRADEIIIKSGLKQD